MRSAGVLVAVGEAGFGAYTLPGKQVVTIGRSSETDVPIDEPSISREHAAIHFAGDDVYLEDLGSSNGTRVREGVGERALAAGERVRIASGTIVILGAVMLMFQARAARTRPRRLWPEPLFEERIEEECAHAARDQRTFAIVTVRASAATVPTATIDLATGAVNAQRAPGGPQQVVEEVLVSEAPAGDVIAASETAGVYYVLMSPAAPEDGEALIERLEAVCRDAGVTVELACTAYPRDGRSPETLLAHARGAGPPVLADVPHELVVRDPQMLALLHMIDRIANIDATVLLLGETGVGKEVIAETIHRRSSRAAGPLVRVNCAALPESLLESELFGHERGAFTGADQAKPGLFEAARGGTIFLDEIGEISLAVQARLLRVLEERTVMRIGARTPTDIDVRVVAATNRSLEREVAAGRFRQDLYFRLHVFPLEIPPLRERVVEIAALATAFVATISEQLKRRPPRLGAGAIAALESYAWPGNIRELRNVVQRATVLCQGDEITEAHLPLDRAGRTVASRRTDQVPTLQPVARRAPDERFRDGVATAPPQLLRPSAANLQADVEKLERDRIVAALEECAGNQTRAAALLGITRRVLMNRLDRYGIARPRK